MTVEEDLDMLAAEFVLGTLDTDERRQVESRKHHEPELADAIARWESRFAPLDDQVVDRSPPDLLPQILARLSEPGAIEPAASEPTEVVLLKTRLSRWRTAALLGYALAACLVVAVFVQSPLDVAQPSQNFVAVFQENDQLPSFLLSINLETRELVVRPIGAEPHAGKSYQLWVVSEQLGASPLSLGLLESPSSPTHKQLEELDPRLLRTATFGISLEPSGGSPTGTPTGPALHGKLIPTTSTE